MMTMNEVTTYTSPWGITYDVVAEKQSRADYREFMNPATRYMREYVQYNFYRDGKRVTFTFDMDEKRLAETFAVLEGHIGAPFSSWLD